MRFRRRLLFLYAAFCIGLGLVWIRAGQLQLIDGDVWAKEAQDRRRTTQRLDAPRGPIISADGITLAEDVPIFQLTVIPWQWKRQLRDGTWVRCERARCSACGAVYFPYRSGRLPRKCSCRRVLGRGTNPAGRGDAYPRDPDTLEGRLEQLPTADLTPLAKALDMDVAELVKLADDRIDHIETMTKEYRERLEDGDEVSSFLKQRVRMFRLDLMTRPFVIVSDVPEEAVRLVKTNEAGRYRGFGVQAALRRRYPLGDFAPQMLGYTSQLFHRDEYDDLVKKHGKRITLETRVGRKGLERAHNWMLHGEPGRRVLELGPEGTFSKTIEHVEPEPGRVLRLSLDCTTSQHAERILHDKAKPEGYAPKGRPSGGFVLIDVFTGEILVWAEAPRFNLNTELSAIYDVKNQRAIADRKEQIWVPPVALEPGMDYETWAAQLVKPVPLPLSRVSEVAVEPGSTFKPLIGLALLSSGLPLPFPALTCGPTTTKPGCHNCGTVGLEMAITKSCNRWFALSLRDSVNWGTYRSFVPRFLTDFGLGVEPGQEMREWSKGLFLHAGAYDFPLQAAVANATERLTKAADQRRAKHPDGPTVVVPDLELRVQPGAPGTVGGNPKGLGRTIAKVARWMTDRSGADRLVVSVHKERIEGSRILLKVGMRAARRPGWFALPGAAAGKRDRLPPVLRGREAWQAGATGRVERGGTIWFIATFDRKLGRDNPDGVPVIRPYDGRNVGIGQGPVLTTPLQMARAMAVIANGGTVVEPHLVHDLGASQRFRKKHVPLDAGHLERIRRGMYGVANMPEGTADSTPLWHRVPAAVYSKTGTAQPGGPWRPFGLSEDGGPWHHWFVGWAEAPGKRTVAFACVLHSRYEAAAGLTAAPAVQEILEQWYRSPLSDDIRRR